MMDWINNPLLSKMDPVKLELIKSAAKQTSGKSGNSLAPVLMTLITSANRKGIRFTTDEIKNQRKIQAGTVDCSWSCTLEGCKG